MAAASVPKMKEYSGNLYRVDSQIVPLGILSMSEIYTEARPTYFVINAKNSNSYAKHYKKKNPGGDVYLRTFRPHPEPLNLLDLNDVATLQWLRGQVTDAERENIDTSFEIRRGEVYRHSEGETKAADDRTLRAICRLGGDGYYVSAPGLHSEVGLCSSAFGKVQFVSQKIINLPEGRASFLGKRTAPVSPPPEPETNNNTNNGLIGPPPIKRLKLGGTRKSKRRLRKTRKH